MKMLGDHLKRLYDLELYEDVKVLAETFFASYSFKDDPSCSTRYQITCMHADACFHTDDFHSAIKYYKGALQARFLVKGRGRKGMEFPTEADLKFKQYKCYMKLNLFKDALATLQRIPVKQMTVAMKLAHAQLVVKINGEKSVALILFRDVLSHQPLSLTAIKGFLSLGGTNSQVLKLLEGHVTIDQRLFGWVSSWTKAQGWVEGERDCKKAADLLQEMANEGLNAHLMAEAAYMYTNIGDYDKAKDLFRQARGINPLQYKYLDSYAFILYLNNPRCSTLESIASKSHLFPDTCVEAWILNGYYNLSFNKADKAIFFAQKALQLDPQNFEALLLAGISLTNQSEHADALVNLRLAIQTCRHRYEPYYFVTEIYWKTDRRSEARAVAYDYQENYPSSRSHTLYASVLMKDGTFNYERARPILRKAIHVDGENLDAIELLTRVIQTLDGNEEAVQFLTEVAPKRQVASYHKLLASICLKVREKNVKALDHIIVAKRLESFSVTKKLGAPLTFFLQEIAIDGEMDDLVRMGKSGDGGTEESFLGEAPDFSNTG